MDYKDSEKCWFCETYDALCNMVEQPASVSELLCYK